MGATLELDAGSATATQGGARPRVALRVPFTATVVVLPIHILNGVRGNVWIDPIGLAVKDAVPGSRQVRVSNVDVAFTVAYPRNGTVEHRRYVVPTPEVAKAWLHKWDGGETVEPFTFPLSWKEEG